GSNGQHSRDPVLVSSAAGIAEASGEGGAAYLAFVGALFLFIAGGVVLGLLPSLSWRPSGFVFFYPPAAQVETAVALALCVFFAVPYYAIRRRGVRHWLATYVQPSPLMLPFNLVGDVSRTVALAARLFGNMMSGTVIGALLLAIAPLFFPVIMQLFGLLTGIIQAYIFAILAVVYIASAV